MVMKIAVIGASRGIGRALVEYALQEGCEVNALVRDPQKFDLEHSLLTVVEGDARSADAIQRVIEGADAVCTCLGIMPTFKPVDLFSLSGRLIIDAMKEAGIRRLICVTGIGAGDSRGHGGFVYDRILNPLLLKTIYADKEREEELVRNSGLEWTIVRPGFLTNGAMTEECRALTNLEGITAGKISRADTAHFILQEIREPRFIGETPLITY
jgi:putative NADH-flavin reductase